MPGLFADIIVEIAFNAGYNTPVASRVYTDVSDYVEGQSVIQIVRGRTDEFGQPEPSRLTGLVLDNRDGRFTAGRSASPYFPNVRIGRPIRVSVQPPGSPTPSVRFVGFIDKWPTTWDDGGEGTAYAQISASGRTARLGLDTPLSSWLDETFRFYSPLLYWPMSDPEGSLTASSGLPFGPPMLIRELGAPAPLAFGQPTTVLTDTTAVDFSGAPGTGQSLRAAPIATDTRAKDGFSIECYAAFTVANNAYLININMGPAGYLSLLTNATGTVTARFEGEGFLSDCTSPLPYNDGLPHHFVARIEHVAANSHRVQLWVNNVVVATGPTWSFTDGSVSVIGVDVAPGFTGQMCFVAVGAGSAPGDIMARTFQGLFPGTGLGELVFQRLAEFVGLTDIVAPGNVFFCEQVQTFDLRGKTVIEAMRLTAEADTLGIVFDTRDGAVAYHSGEYRSWLGGFLTVTLSTGAGEIETGIAPTLDRARLVNEATVTGQDGSVSTASNAASVAEYGLARDSSNLPLTAEQALMIASWKVNLYGEPSVRIPALSVHLSPLAFARYNAILALEVSDMLAVTGMPSQAPTSTAKFVIEGYTETLWGRGHTIDFNVSPGSVREVLTLDDPVLGQYDAYPLALS